MADTPARALSPRKQTRSSSTLVPMSPPSPKPPVAQSVRTETPVRRSTRLSSFAVNAISEQAGDDLVQKPQKIETCTEKEKRGEKCVSGANSARKSRRRTEKVTDEAQFVPESPDRSETKRRKVGGEREKVTTPRTRAPRAVRSESKKVPKKRVYYKKVVYDGGDFQIGDDVYVKRRDDASSDAEDVEEECRICFKSGRAIMIECEDCLGGFHLKCLKPPLKEVPEGDWTCDFCEAKKIGKEIELPKPPNGKRRARTAREKLLSSDLWAARIER